MSEPTTPQGSPAAPLWRTPPPGDGTVQVVFAGVVAGLALPVLYVAWLNRGGPGEVCRTLAGGQECLDAWSPWPFIGAAVLCFVVAGLLLRSGMRARRVARSSGASLPSVWLGAGWSLVGVLGCVSVLGMLTIGPFIAPIALLLAVVLSGRRDPLTAGLLAGCAALPLAVIAWLHRRGPVNGCTTTADGGQLCQFVPSPWPFAIGAAVALAIAGALLLRAGRRRGGGWR